MSKLDSRLAVEIAGIRFNNPVMGASGTFGYGLEFAGLIDLNRLGGFATKGLSARPLAGNPGACAPLQEARGPAFSIAHD